MAGANAAFKAAMRILDVFDELGLRVCASSLTVIERADGIVVSRAYMAEPFVFADESLRKLATIGKGTLELEFILTVMNGPNVPFEVIVAPEGNLIMAVSLWAE
jgi:hypothetical protein